MNDNTRLKNCDFAQCETTNNTPQTYISLHKNKKNQSILQFAFIIQNGSNNPLNYISIGISLLSVALLSENAYYCHFFCFLRYV